MKELERSRPPANQPDAHNPGVTNSTDSGVTDSGIQATTTAPTIPAAPLSHNPSRDALLNAISLAIAKKEGYFLTQEQAKRRGVRWPTIAQRQNNPGNLRRWNNLPTPGGYVQFPTPKDGWRALYTLCGQYLDGKYHNGKRPSLREWFRVYAPSADKNDPDAYARFVASELIAAGLPGVDVDKPVAEYVGQSSHGNRKEHGQKPQDGK